MDLRSKLVLNGARVAFVVAVAAMAAAPFLFSATHIVLLTEFMSMLILAIMWNLLAGYADIVTAVSTPLSESAPTRFLDSLRFGA
jgi:hypothetical protein